MKHEEGTNCTKCGYVAGSASITQELIISQAFCDGVSLLDMAHLCQVKPYWIYKTVRVLGLSRPNPHTKTERNVKILEGVKQGDTGTSLAKKFGVTRQMISLIVKRHGLTMKTRLINAEFPKLVDVSCKRCSVVFKFMKTVHSSKAPLYCNSGCRGRWGDVPYCTVCKTTDITDLIRAGVVGQRQKYICRPCLRARGDKFGKKYEERDKLDPVKQAARKAYFKEYTKRKRDYLKSQS